MRFYRGIRLSMKRNEHIHPSIDPRTFKRKNSRVDFLCPLCGVKRSITKNFKLTRANYVQICVLAGTLMFVTFSFIGGPVLFIFLLFFVVLSFGKDLITKERYHVKAVVLMRYGIKKMCHARESLFMSFGSKKKLLIRTAKRKKNSSARNLHLFTIG